MTQTSSNKSSSPATPKERTYHVRFDGFRDEKPTASDVCLYYRLLCKIYPHIMKEFIYHPRVELDEISGAGYAGIMPLSSANMCRSCGGAVIVGNLDFAKIFRLARQLNMPTPKMNITTTCEGEALHANW